MQKDDVTLNALTPLVHLIDQAEPDPHLLSDIEAAIDQDTRVSPARPGSWTLGPKGMLALLLAGLMIGAFGAMLVQPEQRVVTRTGVAGPWVSLGSVTLKGPVLRSFIRATCEGQTHFFVTLQGVDENKLNEINELMPDLTGAGEKILVECIF